MAKSRIWDNSLEYQEFGFGNIFNGRQASIVI